MTFNLRKRSLLACFIVSVTITACGGSGSSEPVSADVTDSGNGTSAGLTRLMTAPLGSEFTGLFVNPDGSLFVNVQHPRSRNTATDQDGMVFNKGTVGVVVGADFRNLGDVEPLQLPASSLEKEVVRTALGRYQVLAQTGDVLLDGKRMGDIVAADGTTLLYSSDNADSNQVVADGATGYYVYTNWETLVGGVSRIRLDQLDANGYQLIVREGMLDFSAVNGTFANCFGTVSPWGTPLSAEELRLGDTQEWYLQLDGPDAFAEYLGYPTDGSGDWGNPYDYGYIIELGTGGSVTAASVADVQAEKREALGRFSHENALVMPDRRTAFQSDDGNRTVFFKFVADTAGDLSSGTLYAAKVTQTPGISDPRQAAFAIEWVEMGHDTETNIEAYIADYSGTYAEAKYISDQQINDWAEARTGIDIDGIGGVAASPFSDDRPAFLESRKAAVALGATGEFQKMEVVNFNYELANTWWNSGTADGTQTYIYLAMSSFSASMSDTEGDIQLDGADSACGAVYRMMLVRNAEGLVDVAAMVPAIVGGPYTADPPPRRCDVENIANPDNLAVLNDGRVLISEDGSYHEQNMIWLFEDPDVGKR